MEERLSWEWEALGCEPERSIQHTEKTRRDLPREGKGGAGSVQTGTLESGVLLQRPEEMNQEKGDDRHFEVEGSALWSGSCKLSGTESGSGI